MKFHPPTTEAHLNQAILENGIKNPFFMENASFIETLFERLLKLGIIGHYSHSTLYQAFRMADSYTFKQL